MMLRSLGQTIGALRPAHACARNWFIASCFGLGLIADPLAVAANESNAASLAAHQLVAAQLPSGQFAFEYDFLLGGYRPGTEVGIGRLAYITREAAAAYGLSSYLLHEHDVTVARALVAALRNFETLSLPIAKAPGQAILESTGILRIPFGRYKLHDAFRGLGLLYTSVGDGRLVSYDRTYQTAWGGATALSLLTELQFYRATGDSRFERLRLEWLRGLLVLYDAKWGFRDLPDSIDENALSNGEIWLALAYYTRLFPDNGAIARVVAQVDEYMIRTYIARPSMDFYSWGANAAAQRFHATSDPKFREFIAQLTRTYLDRAGPPASSGENSCSEVEGLGAALHVLEPAADSDRDLIVKLRKRIDTEMAENRSLQIQRGQTRIELGSGAYLSSHSLANYAGAFLAGPHDPYVRIDYTEHCISALLDLRESNH